ncbi:hypothetical protein [Streptomyces mesophilus]|uniref:hypothetical protein n=1 Tax=Streptomyces mesophilus TaxID=1775132 RepID=UPI00331B5F7C
MGEKISAGLEVKGAFEKLMEQRQISAELGFDGTADEILTQLKKDDVDAPGTLARTLADARVSFGLSSDKPLDSLTEKEWEKATTSLGFAMGSGKDLIEVRAIGDTRFIRGDIKGIIEQFDLGSEREDMALFDEMTKSVDELPGSLGSVKAALSGEWIEIDQREFEEFSAEQFTEDEHNSLFPGGGFGEIDAKDQQKILDAFGKALGENGDIKAEGKKDGAERFKVTLPARDTASDLLEGLEPLEDKLGLSGIDAKDFADKDVDITIDVKDGMVSKLSFDPNQLDRNSDAALPVTIALKAGGDPVKAPAGAEKLNPQDVLGAFAFMAMQNGEWENNV